MDEDDKVDVNCSSSLEGLQLKMNLKIEVDGTQDQDYGVTESGSFQKGNFKINQTWNKDWKLADLKTTSLLGQGASGVVYKAIHLTTSSIVALKLINVFENSKRDAIKKELDTLVYVPSNNKFVVGFFGAFYHEGTIYLALEYMEGGSLKDIYELSPAPLEEPILSIISAQILHGLRYLHKTSKTVHRDLKPSNILMNTEGQFKITDFGVSKKQTSLSKCNSFIGTMLYMSPERLNAKEYGFSSDVWSFGVTVLELAVRAYPFVNEDQKVISDFWELFSFFENKKNMRRMLMPLRKAFSEEFCSFIEQCLTVNPKKRPNVSKLLNHDWIKRYNTGKGKYKLKYDKWYKVMLKKVQVKHKNAPLFKDVKKNIIQKLSGMRLD